jgi:hypothetical protein
MLLPLVTNVKNRKSISPKEKPGDETGFSISAAQQLAISRTQRQSKCSTLPYVQDFRSAYFSLFSGVSAKINRRPRVAENLALIVVSYLINPPSPKIHEKSFDGMKGGHFDHADVVGATNIACADKVAWREVSEQRPTAAA